MTCMNARWPGGAALIVAALLVGPVLAGCAGQPPAPAPTSPPQATYTPYPTYTPLPTQAPPPTASATPAPTVAAAQPTAAATSTPAPTPTPTPFVYTVKPGDSASLIAKRFGVTLPALLAANNLLNPDVVELGRQLVIPISGTGTLTATLPTTRTVVRRPAPTLAPSQYPSEAATADPNQCETRALLIIHTRWNGAPEPGIKFDFHSQPFNPVNDPAKFRYSTNEKGTAYFCMPPHTRLYFFLDRDMAFDSRVELGQVEEKFFDVPRLDLTLVGPLGNTYKPETPVPFSWKPYPGAASYVLTVYGQQRNFWGGEPQAMAYQARLPANQTQATASFSPDPVKGIYLGQPLQWMVTAQNARGTVIGKSKEASFALIP